MKRDPGYIFTELVNFLLDSTFGSIHSYVFQVS